MSCDAKQPSHALSKQSLYTCLVRSTSDGYAVSQKSPKRSLHPARQLRLHMEMEKMTMKLYLWAHGRGTKARGKERDRGNIDSRASSPEADETDWIPEVCARARLPEHALQVSVCQRFESAWLCMATSRQDTSCVVSCRIACPGSGDVTSDAFTIGSSSRALSCPPFQTMPCHLIFSSLGAYLLSSHLLYLLPSFGVEGRGAGPCSGKRDLHKTCTPLPSRMTYVNRLS